MTDTNKLFYRNFSGYGRQVINMRIKKIVVALIILNMLQILMGLIIWFGVGIKNIGEINALVYLPVGLLMLSSIITIHGLYLASKFKYNYVEESIKDLEELNTRLRMERHDYINHFQVIYGLMELEEYEESKKYLEPVFKDILKVSKALKTSQPAVNALLQAKVETAEKLGIDLYLEIQSELKKLPLEPWNLCKVIANIIDNSIAAVSLNVGNKSIHIEIRENNERYEFTIYNNGPVITPEQMKSLFHQGYSTKKEAGHGMGLFIVSKILEEIKGTITVESDEGKTTFTILLPKPQTNN